MSDGVRIIDPKIFEYLSKPESERVAPASEPFQSDTKKGGLLQVEREHKCNYIIIAFEGRELIPFGFEVRREKIAFMEADDDEDAESKFERWKDANRGHSRFALYKKLV